ncbi:MAG: homoserine kinase [Spirochaetaceae bacterium]|nr:homoserine kinase [Spirochaetaceae bacterium]
MTALPRRVTAFAPATVANVGSGFDVLGFAVERPGDTVEAHRRDGRGVALLEVTGDGGRLPRDASNTAVVAAGRLLERLGEPFGVDLVLHKGMPLASGLGSSAASAAAALRAVNRLAGDPLTAEELLPCALAAEQVAAGTGHADNAAPALMGGFVLIRSTAPLDLVRLPVPDGLAVALLSPDVEIPTEAARRILRKRIPLADAVSQWGNLAALVASLYAGDLALMGRSLHDLIAEPVRAVLIPGFAAVKEAALQAGAIGCSISGAGPAVFALAASLARAHAVAEAMRQAFADAGLTAAAYVSEISRAGPRIAAQC